MTEIRSNNSLRDEEKHEKMKIPDIEGEESIGGSTPVPESDDDVTEMEHEHGLYLEEDVNTPEEADFEGERKDADERLSEK